MEASETGGIPKIILKTSPFCYSIKAFESHGSGDPAFFRNPDMIMTYNNHGHENVDKLIRKIRMAMIAILASTSKEQQIIPVNPPQLKISFAMFSSFVAQTLLLLPFSCMAVF